MTRGEEKIDENKWFSFSIQELLVAVLLFGIACFEVQFLYRQYSLVEHYYVRDVHPSQKKSPAFPNVLRNPAFRDSG